MLTPLLLALGLYALFGIAFGAYFALRLAPARDPVAAAAPLRVRLLFAFGAIALWPVLLRTPPHQRAIDASNTNPPDRPAPAHDGANT